jgi:hypothetical protein
MINSCKSKTAIFLICLLTYSKISNCQRQGLYPPFTKWYQDPLGLTPIELSTAFGFVWASAAVTACLVLTNNDSAFHKRISAYSEEGYSLGYKSPYTGVLHNELGLVYGVRKWLASGLGCNLLHFKDKINNTWTIGVVPFARWYPYQGKRIRFFIQYGAGISYSLKKFPLTGTGWESDTARTGTKFNLMSKYGCGAEFHITKRLSFQTTVIHFHLSNGNIKGIQRNPSHDSNGLFVAVIYNPN